MPYSTSFERLSRPEGRKEGILENVRDSVLEVLETRTGAIPFTLQKRIRAFDVGRTPKKLHRRAVLIPGIDLFYGSARSRFVVSTTKNRSPGSNLAAIPSFLQASDSDRSSRQGPEPIRSVLKNSSSENIFPVTLKKGLPRRALPMRRFMLKNLAPS